MFYLNLKLRLHSIYEISQEISIRKSNKIRKFTSSNRWKYFLKDEKEHHDDNQSFPEEKNQWL